MLKELFKKTKYISLNDGIEENKNITKSDRYNREKTRGNTKVSRNKPQEEDIFNKNVDKKPAVPDGMWIKCETCGEILYSKDVNDYMHCCPRCDSHFRINAIERLHMIIDDNSFEEWDKNKTTENILNFPDYEDKIKKVKLKTGMVEAVITGEGTINGYKTAIAIMDSNFLMGSMGQVVGEKITKAVEMATKSKLPIIIFSTSGGARMQEGIVSLMQMAKTSAALKRHSEAGYLYISVLTDPTTGGVTASFAMLGDIILGEPGALIGFAGPRVIEQTIGQKLPDGFQRSEFLLEKGFIDRIVRRTEMKVELAHLLMIHRALKVNDGSN